MGIAVAINTIQYPIPSIKILFFLPSFLTSTTATAMEQEDKAAETTSFVPVIARLDRLDLLLEVLEEKHSSSTAGSPAPDCRTLSSALQEVKHKGTLLDRLALLEKRVLQLSVEIEEGKTSKSSSWTDSEVSNSSHKKKDENYINGVTVTPSVLLQRPQVKTTASSSSGDGFGKEIKGGGQKKKPHKKWIWLLRLRC